MKATRFRSSYRSARIRSTRTRHGMRRTRSTGWKRSGSGRRRTCPTWRRCSTQRRVLLLLDALNEMPHRDADDFRERVEKWRCFLRDDFPPGNRAVFSCRSLDYSEPLSVKDDLDVRAGARAANDAGADRGIPAAVCRRPCRPRVGRDSGQRTPARSLQHALLPEAAQPISWPTIRAWPASARRCSRVLCDARWSARSTANNPLFVRDGVLLARDRERIVRHDWDDAARPAPARAADPAPAGARIRHAGAFRGSDGKQVMVTLDEALARLEPCARRRPAESGHPTGGARRGTQDRPGALLPPTAAGVLRRQATRGTAGAGRRARPQRVARGSHQAVARRQAGDAAGLRAAASA